MVGKISRLILAFTTFPALGAYSLRWLGGYVADLARTVGLALPLLAWLDLGGMVLGLVLGLWLAVAVSGCALQPPQSPVRPPGDTILIVLGLTVLGALVADRSLPGHPLLVWLPAATLAVWAGCAAATMTLQRMRQDYRAQAAMPPRR